MKPLQAFLDGLVSSGVSSSAVALVATPEEVLWEGAAGEARPGVPAIPSTRFDFASLTKPFVATLALVLDDERTLPLATTIGEVWPEAHPKLGPRPLSDLFRHRSGLLGWTPLYLRCQSLEEVRSLLLSGEVLGARAGTYSDLGYILWALTVERRTGQSLGELIRSRVLAPLALSRVEITPGERPDLAESRMGTGKEQELAAAQGFEVPDLGAPPVGLPQDGNARHLLSLGWKGVSGQAGLFGGVRDLWRLGAEWLAPGRLLKREEIRQALSGGGPFAHGWRRRTVRGSAGRALSRSSFGHTGFAGNSVWIDPEANRVLVLLSSRLDPISNVINRWRRRFHTVAARAF